MEGSVGGSVLEGTKNLTIRVRIANAERADLSQIVSLDLQPENGGGAPRSSDALGDFDLVPKLAKISRRNEQRVNYDRRPRAFFELISAGWH